MSSTIARSTVKRVQSFILSRHVETGQVASPAEIAKALKIPSDEAALAVKVLIQSGTLFQSGGTLFLNQEVARTMTEEVAEDPPKKKREPGTKPDFARWSFAGIQLLMFFVSASAVFISIYFSRLWLDSFLSPGKSLLLATVMVLYATVAPQVTIIFLSRKRAGSVVVGSGMLATALLVTVFSMISTVAGQYDAFTVNSVETAVEVTDEATRAAEWDLLQTEERELVDRIADKQEEIDTIQKILAEFDTLEERTEANGAYYVTTRNDLARLNRELEALRDQLSGVRSGIREALASGEAGYLEETRPERRDFYQWVSGIVGLSADRVQFWLAVFPAVFVDVIAPLALAVGLFLTGKKRRLS